MNDKTFLSVFRIWASCAWADGVLDFRESASLENLVTRNREISDLARRTAISWIDQAPEFNDVDVRDLSESARWKVYEAAFALAVIDETVTEEERHILDRIITMLELDEDKARVKEKECIKRLFM